MRTYPHHLTTVGLWVIVLAVGAAGVEPVVGRSGGLPADVPQNQRLPDGRIGPLPSLPRDARQDFRITAEWRRSEPSAATISDKPLWKFSVAVGLSERTEIESGGFDRAVPQVLAQFETLNHRFNDSGFFKGEIQFSVDYIYDFVGQAPITCPPGFDFAAIYEHILEADTGMRGSWGMFCGIGSNAVLLAWSPMDGDPFAFWPTNILIHEFGHTRGAIDEYSWWVPSQNNPVNGAEYPLDSTIMGSTQHPHLWDQHSINLINLAADSVLTSPAYLAALFPDTIGVRVVGSDGAPLSGAEVRLYPVEFYGFHVSSTPSQQRYTGADGRVVLDPNPFGPCDCWNGSEFASFLVTASLAGKTAFSWMPVDDVENAHFADSTSPFWLTVKFDDLTGISGPEPPSLPTAAVIGPNYPNPFNGTTVIPYHIPSASRVLITVYDLEGQRIRTLVDKFTTAGDHRIVWDGCGNHGEMASTGVYFIRLDAGKFTDAMKVLYLK
jgi:hypothetical protein